jgi:hypothetical protein
MWRQLNTASRLRLFQTPLLPMKDRLTLIAKGE